MARPSSNIRVFVDFARPAVFAGEDVECTITFKNVQQAHTPSKLSQLQQHPPRTSSTRHASIQSLPDPSAPSPNSPRYSFTNAHFSQQQRFPTRRRSGASVDLDSPASPATRTASVNGVTGKGHGRSVSIVSLTSDRADTVRGGESPVTPSTHPVGFKHTRATSLQVLPGRHSSGISSPPLGNRSNTQPSPLSESVTHPNSPESTHNRRPSLKILPTIESPTRDSGRRQPSISQARGVVPSYREQTTPSAVLTPLDSNDPNPYFAAAQLPGHAQSPPPNHVLTNGTAPLRSPSPRGVEGIPRAASPAFNRIWSLASVDGTPRSSGEFYSTSNRSDETLASEYPMPLNASRNVPAVTGLNNLRTPATRMQGPETIMMGYVKVTGSFVVDASLINQAPFEEVKRKGALGGQGGVVGMDKAKLNPGLFGSLGWASIGQSIGGILGNNELSSIKEIRGQITSKRIPILSTPQSILFVDLRLAPGESRSYRYSFTLPKNLPPTHRGRAMKTTYRLVIGTQRPATAKNQKHVRHVEIPFRVFGGITPFGESIAHDLMSPHVLLKDTARTSAAEQYVVESAKATTTAAEDADGAEDFQAYVDALLNHSKSRRQENKGILSPTEEREKPDVAFQADKSTPVPTPTSLDATSPRVESAPPSAQSIIEHAIHRSRRPHESSPNQSRSHFTIARAGIPVATLILPRPAFRLGDSLTFILDFSPSTLAAAAATSSPDNASQETQASSNTGTSPSKPQALPAYAVAATLESHETVSTPLALRSAVSIERATRRVWRRDVRCVLFSDRVAFRWQIPGAISPFQTPAAGENSADNSNSGAGFFSGRTNFGFNGLNIAGMNMGFGLGGDADDDRAAAASMTGSSGSAATPEFVTSGVQGGWRLRIEIVVARGQASPTMPGPDTSEAERGAVDAGLADADDRNSASAFVATSQTPAPSTTYTYPSLLEEIAADERGAVLAAAQDLPCESFEVCVPIKVFGPLITSGDGDRASRRDNTSAFGFVGAWPGIADGDDDGGGSGGMAGKAGGVDVGLGMAV